MSSVNSDTGLGNPINQSDRVFFSHLISHRSTVTASIPRTDTAFIPTQIRAGRRRRAGSQSELSPAPVWRQHLGPHICMDMRGEGLCRDRPDGKEGPWISLSSTQKSVSSQPWALSLSHRHYADSQNQTWGQVYSVSGGSILLRKQCVQKSKDGRRQRTGTFRRLLWTLCSEGPGQAAGDTLLRACLSCLCISSRIIHHMQIGAPEYTKHS